MEHDLTLIACTGTLAGIMHVLTGPDHLAAIAPLSADSPAKSWKSGFWWGVGHTGSVWLMGLFLILFKDLLPLEQWSDWNERAVGVVLIALGLWGMKKNMQPSAQSFDPKDQKHRHTGVSFGIGVLHGFAGSSHFLSILPALALPGTLSAALYIGGFGLGTILAMAGFSWTIGMLIRQYFSRIAQAYRWAKFSLCLSAVAVGAVWML